MGWVVLLGKGSADSLEYEEAKYVSGENVAGRVQSCLEHVFARLQEAISIFTMMFLSCQHIFLYLSWTL